MENSEKQQTKTSRQGTKVEGAKGRQTNIMDYIKNMSEMTAKARGYKSQENLEEKEGERKEKTLSHNGEKQNNETNEAEEQGKNKEIL